VLKRLEENDLFVKLEKCKWKLREVEFLGVVIGPKGVEMQKEKVEGVLNWPAPRNIKEVQKFLGLTNYYRRFIKDFARIVAVRATGHKTPGESSVILQIVVMVQLTSKRILRD